MKHRCIHLIVIVLGLAISAGQLLGCKGPSPRDREIPLTIDHARLAPQWLDGPRRQAAEAELQAEARRVAMALFPGDPMPTEAPEAGDEARVTPPPADVMAAALRAMDAEADQRPAWADGVPEPPAVLEHDLPRGWPVVVKRGETPALLAGWAGTDTRMLLTDNAETLGKRRWLKTGDRLMVTMSANQKVAFDHARESFQKARLDAYFAKRYFEKVVVYRVKRGEYVMTAAKRYGDVPLWLLEEFNQADFRALQPGDEILIPVVATFESPQKDPPPLRVVDEEGRPVSDEAQARIDAQMRKDLLGRARVALDDSNVFERGESVFAASAQDILPDYAQVNARPVEVDGAGEAVEGPPAARPVARDIIVKRGETLLHYTEWSGVTLDEIKATNPRMDPDHILVGSRIALPLTDSQYVAFMAARTEAGKATDGGGEKGEAKVVAKAEKRHAVKAGETASAIAKRHKASLRDLRALNPGVNLDRLSIGQELRLP